MKAISAARSQVERTQGLRQTTDAESTQLLTSASCLTGPAYAGSMKVWPVPLRSIMFYGGGGKPRGEVTPGLISPHACP